MVRIRNLLFYTIFMLWSIAPINAQSIRKDHREMTPSEKRVYRDAVIARRDFLLGEATHHANHFNTEIHTRGTPINGTQFLSWHRLFMLEIESSLKTSGVTNADKISIPYWNWTEENSSSNITWGNTGFLDLGSLNSAQFNITRSLSSPFATSGDLTSMNNLSSFMPTFWENPNAVLSSFFSKRLERWHNFGHDFIGGTMNTTASPRDPLVDSLRLCKKSIF